MNERRLSDRILAALELALQQDDLDIADHLGHALELALTRFGGPDKIDKRDYPPEVETAFGRLEALRQRYFSG